MMVGGLTSGAMPAMASHGLDPFMQNGNAVLQGQELGSHALPFAPSHSFSITESVKMAAVMQAPSLAANASGEHNLLGAGGMAASTALKMLRAGI